MCGDWSSNFEGAVSMQMLYPQVNLIYRMCMPEISIELFAKVAFQSSHQVCSLLPTRPPATYKIKISYLPFKKNNMIHST